MGRVKEMLLDMQEEAGDRNIANALGISFDELIELDWNITEDSSKDGMTYGYHIEFTDDSSPIILSKINNLEDGNTVYLQPWDLEENYDYDQQFDAITEDTEYVQRYKDEIANLEALIILEIPDEQLKEILYRQIFISIIGTIETFLCDTFINLTFENETYFRNFIESHPEFKKRRFDLREIYEKKENLKEIAKKVMLGIIYHNLPIVKKMYKDTFKINFPEITDVYDYVLKRHDLVHRNGRTKEGEVVKTDDNAIKNLIKKSNVLIDELITELQL